MTSKEECQHHHTFPFFQQYNDSDQNTLWNTVTKFRTANSTPSQFDISPLQVPFFCTTADFNEQKFTSQGTKNYGLQIIKFTASSHCPST
jgi:hypothetical protein